MTLVSDQWRIQDLPKWGADHGERAEREPKRGSGGEAPSGVQGQTPWWGVRGRSPPEAESFLYIFMQKSGLKLRVYVKICPRV